MLLVAMMVNAQSSDFPSDPGTLVYNIELVAAVIDGDQLPDYTPEGAGGYAAGTEVLITAQDISGYEFVRWSDGNTENPRTYVVEQSVTLTAYYSRKQIEIAVAANAWTFFCLPPLGDKQYTADMFTYEGLTEVKWGTYNGSKRAEGRSGWETTDTYNATQGYIIYSSTAGTLRINAYQNEIRQGETAENDISAVLSDYSSVHPENASWNFLGNPYSQGYNIAGLAAAGIESPIAVWNGTGYDTYTPGIDTYILQPFEAFFIQKAEGGAESITFSREYLSDETSNNGNAPIEGELSGAFSVSATTTVHFSQGNLQYVGTWQFAEHQWDYFGSEQSDDHRDLFGWGTGDAPNKVSPSGSDYSTFVDWGSNAITNGGNTTNQWRTLKRDEWVYLFNTRTTTSGIRYAKAVVNDVSGVIVLPDAWSESYYALSSTNTAIGAYTSNTITSSDWTDSLEAHGAVFLPAAGYRDGTDVNRVDSNGSYWSATPFDTSHAYCLDVSFGSLLPQDSRYSSNGLSVRLVR